jgi:hypothetical protein
VKYGARLKYVARRRARKYTVTMQIPAQPSTCSADRVPAARPGTSGKVIPGMVPGKELQPG